MARPMPEIYRELIEGLGEDCSRPGLKDTPERAAAALQFLTQGYNMSLEQVVGDALFASDSSDMVIVRNIELYSLCEHHLLPFIGHCHVGYLPCGKLLGLSKVARIVDLYARRLQIQEHLNAQIAHAIAEVTGARGVGVVIESRHLCMMMRGVEKQNSAMRTSTMLGAMRDNQSTREEFLTLIR